MLRYAIKGYNEIDCYKIITSVKRQYPDGVNAFAIYIDIQNKSSLSKIDDDNLRWVTSDLSQLGLPPYWTSKSGYPFIAGAKVYHKNSTDQTVYFDLICKLTKKNGIKKVKDLTLYSLQCRFANWYHDCKNCQDNCRSHGFWGPSGDEYMDFVKV